MRRTLDNRDETSISSDGLMQTSPASPTPFEVLRAAGYEVSELALSRHTSAPKPADLFQDRAVLQCSVFVDSYNHVGFRVVQAKVHPPNVPDQRPRVMS